MLSFRPRYTASTAFAAESFVADRASSARAYLVTNPQKDRALAEFRDLERWLAARGALAGADVGLDLPRLQAAAPQRIVVLGGDGTILAVGRDTVPLGVPIVGVNLGKLGYMASYSSDDLRKHVEPALNRDSLVSARMTLDVEVDARDAGVFRGVAINDCVLHTGPPFRMLGMEIRVDGFPLTTITADGLILATPTGSTAHNMAAGGPVVEPEVEAIVMTSICPHSFAHRPVVMAATSELRVTVMTAHEGTTAMIDGQVAMPTPEGTVITVRRGRHPFRLVRHPNRTSWAALVHKLKWGDSPGANHVGIMPTSGIITDGPKS